MGEWRVFDWLFVVQWIKENQRCKGLRKTKCSGVDWHSHADGEDFGIQCQKGDAPCPFPLTNCGGGLEGFRVGAEKLYAQEHASYRGCTDKKDWAALPTRASMHWDHTRGSSSSNLFLRSDKRKRREKGRQTLGAQETNWNAGWSIPVSSVTPFDPSLTPRDRFSFFASPSFPLSIRIIR